LTRLAIAWVLWCFLHSALIARPVTGRLRLALGPRYHRYRLFYNLFALVTLAPLVICWKALHGTPVFTWEGLLIPLRWALLAASAWLFHAGARVYDMRQFLGLPGTATGAALSGDGTISDRGILGRTRHPWYLAGLLVLWSFPREIDAATLVTNLLLSTYLVLGTLLEERKLAAEFGCEYAQYRKRVPMLVPLPVTGRWRTARRLIYGTSAALFLAINLVAFMHAGAMTRFTPGGAKTPPPESLSMLEKARTLVSGVSLPRPESQRTPADLGLAYERHRFPGSNGHELEAWFIPGSDARRELVLLFHGYAAGKAEVLPTARHLHQLGCTVFMVDFFGSGGSSGSGTTIGYREAEDVAAVFRFARRTWPDRVTVLYGVSMGGAAVLRAVAIEGVMPDALVAESTFDSLLNTVRARFRAMGLPPSPLSELLVFWGGARAGFNAFSLNPASYAARVACPALVLHGEIDARVSNADAHRIFEALTGLKRISAYPGAGHQLLSETDATRWRADMDWLLDTVGGAGGHR